MPTRPMASTCKLISRRCDALFSRLPGRRLSGNNRAGVELRPSSRPTRPVAYRGVELDPLYVDVIVRRFEAATGNQAVLVETGETFEALATQGAGTGVGLRPAPAVADVADEPPRNGRLLPVKRAGVCTAEVRGSNPLSSTRKSPRTTLGSRRPQSLDYLVR